MNEMEEDSRNIMQFCQNMKKSHTFCHNQSSKNLLFLFELFIPKKDTLFIV